MPSVFEQKDEHTRLHSHGRTPHNKERTNDCFTQQRGGTSERKAEWRRAATTCTARLRGTEAGGQRLRDRREEGRGGVSGVPEMRHTLVWVELTGVSVKFTIFK